MEPTKRAPAFQLYPQDFISSLDVQMMSAAEVGAYCLLLFNSWTQPKQCYLPNDEAQLMFISKLTSEQWKQSKKKLLAKFPVTADKKFRYNPRLISEAENHRAFRERQAENGKRGGRPRKDEPSAPAGPLLGETQNNPGLSQSLEVANPTESSSTSSSTSTSSSDKKEIASKAGVADLASPIESSDEPQRLTPRPPKAFRYDNAPVFIATEFHAYLLSQGYGQVDWGMYLVRITEHIKNTLADPQQRKIKVEATNDEWKKFILAWLDRDKGQRKLLLPDAAPVVGYAGPNTALQVTTSGTSYSPAAIAARNVTKY